MARKYDVKGLKKSTSYSIEILEKRIGHVKGTFDLNKNPDLLALRWVFEMSAVDLYATWERYAEKRLTSQLNHYPDHFIKENELTGVRSISVKFAEFIIRKGRSFFDFRSISELKGMGTIFLGHANNPFKAITADQEKYLDALSAIRNKTVHDSDFARAAYRKKLNAVYGLKSAPEPDEFLRALDNRKLAPAKGKERLFGLLSVVKDVIKTS